MDEHNDGILRDDGSAGKEESSYDADLSFYPQSPDDTQDFHVETNPSVARREAMSPAKRRSTRLRRVVAPVRYRAGTPAEGQYRMTPSSLHSSAAGGVCATILAAREAAAAQAASLIRTGNAADLSHEDDFWSQHKVARGRGRKKQLDRMTAAEKMAERDARMERMRLAARECRLRKKLNAERLEEVCEEYAERDAANELLIVELRNQLSRLQGKADASSVSIACQPRHQPRNSPSPLSPISMSSELGTTDLCAPEELYDELDLHMILAG